MTPLRQFLVYGIGGAASRLAAIVLVPLYTRTLSVEAYGELELALALHVLVVLLAGLQVESAVARDLFAARDAGDAAALGRAALQLTLVGSAAVAVPLGLLPVSGLGSTWLPASGWWLLIALTLPAQLSGVQLVMLRFEGRATLYAVLSFLELVLAAAASLALIVGAGLGLDGALAGMLVAKSTSVALAWPLTFGRLASEGGTPSRVADWRRRLLGYGLPGMPAVLVNWASSAGSRVLLAAAMTLQDVALAGLALKAAAIFGFLVFSLRLAWEPHSMRRLEQHAQDPDYFRRAFEAYALLMFVGLAAALLAAPLAIRILAPPAYASALEPALFMIAAQYGVGMVNMTAIAIQAARRPGLFLQVYGWGAALNAGLLLALAPALGPLAAGVALLAGSVASAFVSVLLGNRVFDAAFPVRLLGVAAAASTGLPLALLTLHRIGAGQPGAAGVAWFGGGALAAIIALLVLAAVGVGHERCRNLLRSLRASRPSHPPPRPPPSLP